MSKESITVYVDGETMEVIESVRDASTRNAEMWDMSTSEAAREFIEHGIESLGKSPDLEDLVDDLDLSVWRKQQQYDRTQKRGRIEDMRGGWRGRVRSRFNGRLSGSEPYAPDVMENLAGMYMEEIEIWEDDEERIEDHRQWLDELVREYRDSYQCKQVVPNESFEAAVDDVSTGADLLALREQFGAVVRDICEISESLSYDPDAILDRLAGDYGVEEEAVEIIIEAMCADNTDPRRALMTGEGIMDEIDPEALSTWEIDPSGLPGETDHYGGEADD